jgi:hypothetical protein
MKRNFIVALIVMLGVQPMLKADEGMWLPIFIDRLNYTDMKSMGLQLTPEEIYNVNNSSLKDAIAIFGGGCTSELISGQGLLLTNHHCGYSRIQKHSSLEHNYLKDGFWAETMEDELPNPGLSVRFLIRIEDVTKQILDAVNDEMTENERDAAVRKKSREISTAAEEGTHYEASVRSFYEGNEYYLLVYERYTDVRLVGTPPSSIGNFGGDTDNWMWPRHTGDFSLFRVYAGKDGKPADYSEDNVPLKPRHYLPVSLDGVREGDFSMILGYPGSTDRYMTSYGVKMAMDVSNQTVVDIRGVKLKIMMEFMQADDDVRIKYATKHVRISNYWKYCIGQNKGLKRLKVHDKKVEIEDKFTDWVNESENRKARYGNALNLVEESYADRSKVELARIYYREAISRGSEILGVAKGYKSLVEELDKKDANPINIIRITERLRVKAAGFYTDYYAPLDEKMLGAMLEMYYKNVPATFQPEYLKSVAGKYKGDFNAFAREVFETSYFVSPERQEELLADPSSKKIKKDLAYQTITSFADLYDTMVDPALDLADNQLDKGNRLFVAGLRQQYPEKKFYPDANSTMRLTYGQVLDYYPADAIHYNYYTTLTGVMEKEDPSNWEFVVPDKLKELYKKKDFGQYGEDGVMKVCFLTNHDITGGNSGSPVINGKGELIGLAFDGNWEAMSGDIFFEPEIQRTINVDIRYVLFIIDKFAGATRLIEEMDLVKSEPKKKQLMEKTELKAEVVEE